MLRKTAIILLTNKKSFLRKKYFDYTYKQAYLWTMKDRMYVGITNKDPKFRQNNIFF